MQVIRHRPSHKPASPRQRFLRQGIALTSRPADIPGGGRWFQRQDGFLAFLKLLANPVCHGWTGCHCFQVPPLTASAHGSIPIHRDVTQFSCQAAGTQQEAIVHDHPATNASADGQID